MSRAKPKATAKRTASTVRRKLAPKGSPQPVFAQDRDHKQLYDAWTRFNRAHFDGRLRTPLILITPTSSPRSLGDYTPNGARDAPRIRIAPSVMTMSYVDGVLMNMQENVLLHQMVHAWQHEVLRDTEPGYRGHGPQFAKRANQIGAVMGYARCAEYGRRGHANATTWPEPPTRVGEEPAPRRGARKPRPIPASTGDPSTAADATDLGTALERASVAQAQAYEDGTLRERERVVRLLNERGESYPRLKPYQHIRKAIFELAREIGGAP